MGVKKASISPLEAWQERYLSSDGTRLTYADFQPKWLDYLPFSKLFDGRKPVFLDHAKSRHPCDLWREFGAPYLAEFTRRHPGQMPLPWWCWEAPGAADPADQGKDLVKYQKAVLRAQRRARWPAEKQTEFLKKHGLKK